MLFSAYLEPGLLDFNNWRMQVGMEVRGGENPVVAAGRWVRGNTKAGIPFPGPPTIDYMPPPFDVVSQDSTAAPAFAGFPLTIL